MGQFSTFNYLFNSYHNGKRETESLKTIDPDNFDIDLETFGFNPPQSCIDTILGFASQYEVIKTEDANCIELNLN